MWVGKHSASSVRVTAPRKGRNLRKVEPMKNAAVSSHCTQCRQQCNKCCSCCSAICTECFLQDSVKQDDQNLVAKATNLSALPNGDKAHAVLHTDRDESYSCSCCLKEYQKELPEKKGKVKPCLKCCCF